ncbi:hypothetical protein ES708_08192 [subsurface metagenome]
MIKIGVTGDFFEMEKEIQLLKEMPEFSLTGIYHYNTKLLKEFTVKHDLPVFSSFSSLIRSCDAIDIAGNNGDETHLYTGILKNSKHLIVNFPDPSSIDSLKHLTKLASEAKVIMQVRNPYRYNPAYIACLSKINKPAVIEIQMEIKQGSKLDNQAVLCIDLIRDMVRSNTHRVNASGISVAGRKVDYLTARIEFDNGSIVNMTINQLSGRDSLIVKIYQQGNRIFINFSEKECYIEKIPFSLFPGNDEDDHERILPEINKINPANEELKQFGNAIEQKFSTGIDIEQALQSIDIYCEIVEKINKTTFHPLQN